ncbi:hypothetical protein C8R45DRAFT_1081419 [Mycena sanguinolenta]|nr:hypothetical protein C8R45DRAFT_1081419 [Mycena sanguinolenta]
MSRPRVSWPLSSVYFLAVSALAVQSLDPRSEQTQAECSADFDWAENSLKLTPCLLAAYVWGSCFTGNWNVPQLTQGNQYTNPNSTTANLCTCSWAGYNLLSACTACQGFDADVQNWAAYNQNCSAFMTNTYFPESVILPTGTAIPFWAGTDPTTWNDGRFNSAQAQLIAQENKPDYVQGQNPVGHKSKPPIGAIAGGVVGGVAVLILGGVAFWFMRKRNQKHPEEGSVRPYPTRPHIHGRSWSDLSGKSILGPHSMSMVNSQRPGTIYTTANTVHTRTTSVHSLPYTSGYASPPLSPPLPAQISNREDHIEPFLLRPTSPPVSMSIARKTSGTTLRSTATTTVEPPAAAVVHERYAPESSERARLNPPPYSPSQSVSPASSPEPTDPTPQSSSFTPGHRTRRDKAAMSVDSQTSYDSGTSHGGDGSVSAIHEVIGRMGLMMPSPESVMGSTMGAHTISTGQSVNVLSRPGHKPSVSNPDNHN